MEDIRDLLIKAEWTLVRKNKHEVWHCPCGKHTTAVPIHSAGINWRNERNAVAGLWRTKCPSLDRLIEDELPTKEERPVQEIHARGYCHFCGKELPGEDFGRKWVEHDIKGMGLIQACLEHDGVCQWHHDEREREKHDRRQPA